MAQAGERGPLEAHRRRAFLTIRARADRAGVNTSSAVAIEQAHETLRYGTMRQIAEAIGVDPLAVAVFAEVIEGEEPERTVT